MAAKIGLIDQSQAIYLSATVNHVLVIAISLPAFLVNIGLGNRHMLKHLPQFFGVYDRYNKYYGIAAKTTFIVNVVNMEIPG